MNRRKQRWTLLVLLLLTPAAFLPVLHARGKSAKELYKEGRAAEAKDDYLAAYEAYAQAFKKDPNNLYYKTSYQRMRFTAAAVHTHLGEKLRDQGDMTGALTEFMRALEIDPSNELAQQDIRAIKEKIAGTPTGETSITPQNMSPLNDVGSPAELKAVSSEPITIHAFEDSKVIYQTVGKIAGINVLFDPDYTGKRVQVDLQNVSLLDALHIIGVITNTFWRPVTNNTIFVAQNTRAKRTELDGQAVQTFYLSNASQTNDLNDIQTALRNVITNGKLYAVPSQNAIVMRATPDELLLARKLIDDLDKARPEVVVDVAVLEVNRTHERNLGIILPQQFTASLQGSTTSTSSTSTTGTTTGTTGTTTTNNGLTLNTLGNLNSNNVAVTVSTATANLLLTDSDTRVLQNPRIRATDGQKADLKVGSKIPIATGSFQTGAATSTVSSLVNTQFQYQDVGVEIEITPVIHYNHDVTLKLKLAITQQNGTVPLSGINEPIFSQRTVDQTIRLKEGEASIMGGLLQQSLTNSFSGTPGLAQIPLLKYLFSNTDKTTSQDEIVFMLVPHVVRGEELNPLNLQEIDTGTGTSISLRRIGTVRVPAAAVEGTPAAAPATGSQNAPGSQNGAPGSGAQTGAAANPAAPQTPDQAMQQASNAANAAPVSVTLAAPPTPPAVGSNFQVAVNVSGGTDVFSVPLQVQYDPTKLTLINVDSGPYLTHDGQTVALVHRDDGSGGVAISASRPPGVAGVSGSGQMCVLTFQAKAAGDSIVSVTKAAARDSKQQALPVITSGTIVHVQ
jgi:general secretion pathway protein D